MATAATVNNLVDWTDAQILKALKNALVDATFAASTSINGRSLSRFSPAELQTLIETYEDRVNNAADDTGGIVLAKFGERA